MEKTSLVFVVALSFYLIFSWTNSYEVEAPAKSIGEPSSVPRDVHFAAAGDWSCNGITKRTVNYIQNKNPDLVLALGDFSYQKGTGCWFNIMSPLINKTIYENSDWRTRL